MEEQEKVFQLCVVCDLEKHARNKGGNHIQHTYFNPKKKAVQTNLRQKFGQLHGWPMHDSGELMKSKMSDLVILLNL